MGAIKSDDAPSKNGAATSDDDKEEATEAPTEAPTEEPTEEPTEALADNPEEPVNNDSQAVVE